MSVPFLLTNLDQSFKFLTHRKFSLIFWIWQSKADIALYGSQRVNVVCDQWRRKETPLLPWIVLTLLSRRLWESTSSRQASVILLIQKTCLSYYLFKFILLSSLMVLKANCSFFILATAAWLMHFIKENQILFFFVSRAIKSSAENGKFIKQCSLYLLLLLYLKELFSYGTWLNVKKKKVRGSEKIVKNTIIKVKDDIMLKL